jgi:ssDNA-binding Zn-finger/Zn-ribbon topoisomerase 1
MFEPEETDEICPRCKLGRMWRFGGDANNIFFVDHLKCGNCNYTEEREQEINLPGEGIEDWELERMRMRR